MQKAVIIGGPTASGKTALALSIANRLPVEIISADSRQLFIGLDIVSAKPSSEELKQVPHHLISTYDPAQKVTAADWSRKAETLISEVTQRGNIPLVVGGSGLYIQALTNPLDEMPTVDPLLREHWNAVFKKYGVSPLQRALKEKDPEYYQRVDKQNHVRIIRALEITESSGKKYSEWRKEKTNTNRSISFLKFKTCMDRSDLYKRINSRVDQMVNDGLMKEARSFHSKRGLNSLETIGYKELFDHFEGKIDLDFAVEKIKQHTRNFAKRQITWFKKDEEYRCIDRNNARRTVEQIKNFMSKPVN